MNKQQTTTCQLKWIPEELPTASQAIEMHAGREAARAGEPFTNTNGRWWGRGWHLWHLIERAEPSLQSH